jgi:hypothetical protein
MATATTTVKPTATASAAAAPAALAAPVVLPPPNPTVPNLWPDDIGETNLTAPLSILQTQAHNLAQRTGGLVVAAVETVTERASSFVHGFVIIAPSLNNYAARIFRVKHGVHFYPLEIITEIDGPNFRAATQEDFMRALAEVFGSAPLKKMVHSLIAQSRVAQPASTPVKPPAPSQK